MFTGKITVVSSNGFPLSQSIFSETGHASGHHYIGSKHEHVDHVNIIFTCYKHDILWHIMVFPCHGISWHILVYQEHSGKITRGYRCISDSRYTGWWLGHPSEKYEFVNWDD